MLARLTLLLLAGCSAAPATSTRLTASHPELVEHALATWQAQRGPAPACANALRQAELVVLDEPLDFVCHDYRAVACLLPGPTVMLRAGLGDVLERETINHEIVHVLLTCSGAWPDGDKQHEDAAWDGFLDELNLLGEESSAMGEHV